MVYLQAWVLHIELLSNDWLDSCRMWEFAVGLFMLQVYPDSLLLVAIYGLVEAASVATLGVLVGEFVDKCPRLRVRILHSFFYQISTWFQARGSFRIQ